MTQDPSKTESWLFQCPGLNRLAPDVRRILQSHCPGCQEPGKPCVVERLRDTFVGDDQMLTEDLPAYMPDGVVSVDERQHIVFANTGAERIFGHDRAAFRGQSLDILIPERYRDVHRTYVEQFLQSDEAGRFMGQRGEITGMRADGEEFPAEASFFKSREGNEVYLTAVVRDITQRKKRERDLIAAQRASEEANEAKDRLIASMNHELRTPLNAISGFATLIENETYGPIENSSYIEAATNIRTSASHLLELVNDILMINDIQAEEYETYDTLIDLSEIVGECLVMNEPRARNAGVTLKNEISGQRNILVDPKLMRQMLINTIANALKFTPAGGTVTVSDDYIPGRELAIAVSDTGAGIDEADLPYVTEMFNQAKLTRYAKTEGLGIGLSLTKAMVESHGGELRIESTRNVGTSVKLVFPAWRVQ